MVDDGGDARIHVDVTDVAREAGERVHRDDEEGRRDRLPDREAAKHRERGNDHESTSGPDDPRESADEHADRPGAHEGRGRRYKRLLASPEHQRAGEHHDAGEPSEQERAR